MELVEGVRMLPRDERFGYGWHAHTNQYFLLVLLLLLGFGGVAWWSVGLVGGNGSSVCRERRRRRDECSHARIGDRVASSVRRMLRMGKWVASLVRHVLLSETAVFCVSVCVCVGVCVWGCVCTVSKLDRRGYGLVVLWRRPRLQQRWRRRQRRWQRHGGTSTAGDEGNFSGFCEWRCV